MNVSALSIDLQKHAERAANQLASGQLVQGESELRAILEVHPTWGFGWKLIAAFLATLARHEQAFHAVRMAAQYLPPDSELFNIAGTLLRDTGQIDPAIGHYFQAIGLNPNAPELHNNLGGAFMLKGELEHAITAFRNAVRLNPGYPEANQNLGSALVAKGLPAEAMVYQLRAAELNPSLQQALSMACLTMLQSADWRQFTRAVQQLQVRLELPGYQAPTPFVFNALPGSTRAQHLQCARQFATEQFGGFFNQPAKCTTTMSQQSRLRIGYLSADFHEHATGYLLAGVLECHDREEVEVYGYSYGPSTGDPMRHRIERACDVFRDIRLSSHEVAASQIAADKVDILIDLKGFTDGGRPQITALRPAPVVVNWLGYPSTLGERRMADYIIGDAVVTPLAHQADYSETLALMPHSYQPTDSRRTMAARPTREAAGLPADAFVFCSFNQIYKITPDVFDVWCRILTAVPGSILWLLEGPPEAMRNLQREGLARGLSVDRLVFAKKQAQPEHLARLQCADLALDTRPYTSHTTGSDALWAGVPLLTQMGETFGARVAASLVCAAGLPELVTQDDEAYVAQAIHLSKNPAMLATMRQHLEIGRGTLPLFDAPRFTRDLERLFATIRKQYLAGCPQAFAVTQSTE
ncbi:MAG: tetratricopeptide repeat protein [Rhodoferax sp.]|nr:tetratricopeptide repeat protein [Rhodoferax sp.]